MIIAIEIENFKSIGSPGVRLELRPITLLFGPNSSGKSTIIQALHYLRHLVLYESGDVDRTDQATGGLDLGGFRRLVHQRDLDRPIRIKIEHTRKCWMDFWLWQNFMEPRYPVGGESHSEDILTSLVKSTGMEVEVRWSHVKESPYIAAYRVFLNGVLLAEVTGDPDRRHIQLRPKARFEDAFESQLAGHPNEEYLRPVVHDMDQYFGQPASPEGSYIASVFSNPFDRVIPDPLTLVADWLVPEESQIEYMGETYQDEIQCLISALIIGPSYVTWRELVDLKYVGPIRDIPPRHLQEIAADKDLSWNRGMAAWNVLFKAGREFVGNVGEWLSSADRLNTGYGVRVRTTIELSDDVILSRILAGEDLSVLDDLRQKLRETTKEKRLVFVDDGSGLELAPSEVGTGLSQIVPVVVAVLHPTKRIVAIEQPELHVHPAVQVGLGDLFIQGIMSDFDELQEQAVDPPPILLIETHSEHLMLRLLRRVEESTDGFHPEHLRPLRPDDLSVNYIHIDPDTRQMKITPLRIDERGEFIDKWPNGFFAERGNELFR